MINNPSNILYLSITDERKKEIADKVKELNENTNTLSVQVTAAEKFKTKASNLIVYEAHEDMLEAPVTHVKKTAAYWEDKLRKSLIDSASNLRSFCLTYNENHQELEQMLKDTKNFSNNKEDINDYLGEMLDESELTTSAINESEKKVEKFVELLAEDKDNLGKLNPKLEKIYKRKSAELEKKINEITDTETLIAETEKQLSLAVYGTIGSAVAIGVQPIVKSLKKPLIIATAKIGAKIAPKLLFKISTKLGSTVSKKVLGGLAVVIVLVEIAGLAAGLAFILKFQEKLSELRTKLLNLRYQSIDLDSEVDYLQDITSNFTAMGETTDDTYTVFSEFKKSWQMIIADCARTKESLDKLKERVDSDKLKFITGQLRTLNGQFEILKKNLNENQIGLKVKTIEEDPISVDSENSSVVYSAFTPNLFIPSTLYSAYSNLR